MKKNTPRKPRPATSEFEEGTDAEENPAGDDLMEDLPVGRSYEGSWSTSTGTRRRMSPNYAAERAVEEADPPDGRDDDGHPLDLLALMDRQR
jgi:hypothetical protein